MDSGKSVQIEALKFHVKTGAKVDVQKEILERATALMEDKSKQNFGCHLIEKYQLFESVDLPKICLKLAENNFIESIVHLIGKRSSHAKDKKIKI